MFFFGANFRFFFHDQWREEVLRARKITIARRKKDTPNQGLIFQVLFARQPERWSAAAQENVDAVVDAFYDVCQKESSNVANQAVYDFLDNWRDSDKDKDEGEDNEDEDK